MRSPSRDNQKPTIIEENVINEYKKSQEGAPVRTTSAFHSILPPHIKHFHQVSSGRGGLGNISRSRTRDSATIPIVHSTGKGGVGSLVAGNGSIAEKHEDGIKDEKWYVLKVAS